MPPKDCSAKSMPKSVSINKSNTTSKKTPPRKRVSQQTGGDPNDIQNPSNGIDSNILELRNLSKRCCDLRYVQDYVSVTVKRVKNLFKLLGMETTWSGRVSKDDVGSAGQVNIDDVDNVVLNGNIREQMTLLLMFIDKNQDIFVSLIYMYMTNVDQVVKFGLNYNFLDHLITKMCNVIALDRVKLATKLNDCLICYHNSTCSKKCSKTAVVPPLGPLLTSRILGFPIGPATEIRQARDQSEANRWPYKMKLKEAYPELSEREKKYIISKGVKLENGNSLLPWTTGWAFWDITKDSILPYIVNDQLLISGPSGATDMLFHVFGIFDNFDPELVVLACVAYMGNPPDHSSVEVLLAAAPYLHNYTSDINAEYYINTIIENRNAMLKII